MSVIKTLIGTIIIVAILQIKIGDQTLESRTYKILSQSGITAFLNDVARGAVQLGRQMYDKVKDSAKKSTEP